MSQVDYGDFAVLVDEPTEGRLRSLLAETQPLGRTTSTLRWAGLGGRMLNEVRLANACQAQVRFHKSIVRSSILYL